MINLSEEWSLKKVLASTSPYHHSPLTILKTMKISQMVIFKFWVFIKKTSLKVKINNTKLIFQKMKKIQCKEIQQMLENVPECESYRPPSTDWKQ